MYGFIGLRHLIKFFPISTPKKHKGLNSKTRIKKKLASYKHLFKDMMDEN